MFTNPPGILAHVAAIKTANFVTPKYIISKDKEDQVQLLNRFCPHRMFPLAEPGSHIENIRCSFHGFEWDKTGIPINNNKNLSCGSVNVGRSGLVMKNLVEPNHKWVEDLASETNLEYSKQMTGKSDGSWLWMMDIQADLFHIQQGKNCVHPDLSYTTDTDKLIMEEGDGWVLQTCSTGWWLFVYPFTFVEWSAGCVAINYTVPNDINNEFGYSWVTQFYYDPNTTSEKRAWFETLENVFHEDVNASSKQRVNYFPLMSANNRLEDHCVHFGKWFIANKN
jgi:nitrite reductase/ring-hydroxylating ferredoxin subunit